MRRLSDVAARTGAIHDGSYVKGLAADLDLDVGPGLTQHSDPSRDHGQGPGSAHLADIACDFRGHPMPEDFETSIHESQKSFLLGGGERLPEAVEVGSQRVKQWNPPAELTRASSRPSEHFTEGSEVTRWMHFAVLHTLIAVRGRQQTVPGSRNYWTVSGGVQTQGDVDCSQTRPDEEDG
jgi:hypothetical protein